MAKSIFTSISQNQSDLFLSLTSEFRANESPDVIEGLTKLPSI